VAVWINRATCCFDTSHRRSDTGGQGSAVYFWRKASTKRQPYFDGMTVYWPALAVDQGRKRILLIATSILAARHLNTDDDLFGGPQGSPRTDALIQPRKIKQTLVNCGQYEFGVRGIVAGCWNLSETIRNGKTERPHAPEPQSRSGSERSSGEGWKRNGTVCPSRTK
jgi:hypothetical protein